MTLNDFKNLNPKDPGSWPWAAKLSMLGGILVACLLAGFFLDWNSQWDQLSAAQADEKKFKDEYLAKKKDAVNLDYYKQQLKDIDKSFGALLKQLPSRSEMEALLVDINQAGLGRGLQFDLFRPAANETVSEFYAELPITIHVTGSFHDLGAFASDIAQLPRIVTLNNLNIKAEKDGLLSMDAVIKTYRYPDEADAAARKANAGEKKP